MRLPPRSVLVVLAIAVLNLGTLHSWGFYTRAAFLAVLGAWGLSVLALFAEPTAACPRRNILGALLIVPLSWILTFAAIITPTLLYAEDFSARFHLWLSSYLGCLSVCLLPASLLGIVGGPRPRWWHRALFVIIPSSTVVLGLTTRALTLVASPDPVIDVYPLLSEGADHILQGRNPYAHDIQSPYGTDRAKKFGVMETPDPRPAGYPPLPLLLSIPPRWFGADVRWSNVIADVLAGLALGVLGWRHHPRFFGIVAMATYLNAVRVPFIIEQAWYEPMIAALLGWGLVFVTRPGGPRFLGHLLLGLALTAKQFGLPLLFPLLAAFRYQWKLLTAGVLIGLALMLPWFLASPHDFLDIVLWKHLQRPVQYGSVTLASWLYHEWGLTLPRAIGWGLAVVLIALFSYRSMRDPTNVALGLGTVLLTFCLCHTQGYFNYFYLTQYLWLFGFVSNLPTQLLGSIEGTSQADNLPSPKAASSL
jgi:hypothetical protein